MFGIGKNQLIRNLCRLAAYHCSYSKQPCDCKYIHDDDENIASMSEQGSGCPELTMAAMLLSQLSGEQFSALAKQAGITINEDGVDVIHMIADFQKKRLAPLVEQIKSGTFNHKKNTKPGKLPKKG